MSVFGHFPVSYSPKRCLEPSDHILDLCCAPGAKLCMIGNVMFDKWSRQSQYSMFPIMSLFAPPTLSYTKSSPTSSRKRRVENEEMQSQSSSFKHACTENNDTRIVVASKNPPFSGSITGVDIALARLKVTKRLVQRYRIPNVRLFVSDGTTFNILAPFTPSGTGAVSSSPSPATTTAFSPGPVISVAQRRRGSKKKHADDLPNLMFCNNWRMKSSSCVLYDKVLLDAPCTLDASVRHILHHHKLGWREFDPQISQQVTKLQRQLLLNAFRLVKDGGIVVYSTCSFCKAQNEDVVAWLLDKEQSAVLVPIEFASLRQWYQSRNCEVPSHLTPAEEGTLPCTLRFYPKRTGTSGMFIAKIMKQPKKTQN